MIEALPHMPSSPDDDPLMSIDPSTHGNSATVLVSRSAIDSPTNAPGTKSPTPGFMERVSARVRPDEQYREEIVRSIFGEVGTPVEDFSCAVVSRILLHGRMYVTSSFVCFYSNLFGFEKIVKIPFCHMRCITKEKTALFIPNAIAIITSRKEYIFRSFWDREEAFRTLKRCQQESQRQGSAGDHSPEQGSSPDARSHEGTPTERGRPSGENRRLSRRGSASEKGSQSSSKSGQTKRRLPWPGRNERHRSSSGGGGEEGRRRSLSNASFAVSSAGSSASLHSTASLHSNADVESGERRLEHPRSPGRREKDANEGSAERDGGVVLEDINVGEGPRGPGRRVVGSDEGGDSEVDVLGIEGSPVDAVNLGATSGGGPPHTKAEEFKLALQALGEGWMVVSEGDAQPRDNSRGSGATVRVASGFACTLQVFFEIFIGNDAEKGLASFHESMGDTEVRATPWKVSGGAMGMTREIRFVHPVKAPIGPNRTRAVKLQRCRTYGEHGLILETSTHLEDIMMSDYFQIEDRLVVQPAKNGGIRADVEVEIKFFKSTMLRKAIETKSLNETKEVWEAFIAMAEETLKNQIVTPLPPDSGQESDDEGRMRRTRERLRERRKHRKHRHHPPPPDHHHGPPPPDTAKAGSRGGSYRPRAKSAAPRLPTGTVNADGKGANGAGGDRKTKGSPSVGVSVRATPLDSLKRWLDSITLVPWLLLGMVFVWELLQFVRFKSETRGFLEASEAAICALAGHDGEVGDGVVMADAAGPLKEELVKRLVTIYARNRFLWPFSALFV